MNNLSNETKEYLSNHLAYKSLHLINLVCENCIDFWLNNLTETDKEIRQLKVMATELGIIDSYQDKLMFHCATYGLDEETVLAVMENGLFSVIGW